jgi:HWE histidine kinase
MWARVAKALDSTGDGRYDVEYRVKQPDGSWRWLSAWGLVEFEGRGANRKPVAIAGASRDLTELKRAAELQRLLVDELNHRVKNNMAMMQSIVEQTLRGAADRLLEDGLFRDLDGETRLEFTSEGVRCSITAILGGKPTASSGPASYLSPRLASSETVTSSS